MRTKALLRKTFLPVALIAVLGTQACVGKFLSTMLSNEGANFKLIEVSPVANTRIRVSFNKPLDKTKGTGTVLSNYSIPGLNLVSVEAGSETHQVFLNLDPADSVRMDRKSYTLTVSNVLNQTLDPLLEDGRSLTFTGARWLRGICQNDDGTNSCPPLAATGGVGVGYTVKIRGDYAVGSNYQWRLIDPVTLVPKNSCLNAKNTNYPTCNDNALPAYDNGLGAGTTALNWSSVISISTPIKVSGLQTGDFRLEYKVQDALGAWQPAGYESTYDFFVDGTPPTNIGLSGAAGPTATPAYTSVTNVTVTNMNVRPRSCTEFPAPAPNCSATPEAPSHYKYRVRYTAGSCPGSGSFGAWSSTEISANIPITYLMASGDGCYDIQVVARDIANNWQCDTSQADGTGAACPGGPGTGSITDFFNNKAYQAAHFELDTSAPTAVFNVGTLPAFDTAGPVVPPYNTGGSTASTSLTAEVTASASVPYYRYRIAGPGQAGVWSNDKVSGAGGVANPYISGTPPGEYISASGLSNGGTYTVDIIGKDSAGNYQSTGSPTSYTFTVNTSVPAAVLTAYTGAGGCVGMQGLPNNPTNNNCFSVTVGGTGVTHYKATFVSGTSCPNADGAYSAATAVGAKFINTSPGFVNGTTYSLCIRGGASVIGPFGLAAGEITRHTFTFDNAPPTGTAVTQLLTPVYATAPASGTIRTVLKDADVIIGNSSGEAVLAYKGAIYQTTDCVASPGLAAVQALTEKSVYTPIQKTAMSNAEQRVCFIGRDAAGNYQTTLQQYSFTVFDPATPADGGGALDNAYVSNFNYTWSGIPTSVTEIRIRICTDSACASPIPGFQNGVAVCSSAVTCAATTSYNVVSNCSGLGCIKALNGSRYYAQLKVTDDAGNASSFGTISDGKVITGGVTGIIRDTNGNAVSGATVTLYQSNCTTSYGSTTSSGTGTFTISNATPAFPPITLATNGHCIKVTASGGRQGTKQFINVDPATNTNAGSIYVVDPTGKGCIVGALVDGSTGSQLTLSNATFTLKDWNGTVISGSPALDPDGKQFVFPSACINNPATDWGSSPYTSPTYTYANGLSSGVYSLQASVPNYYSFTEASIGVTNNTAVHTGYLPMVGTFAAGSKQIKIILTWGTGAKDLDLHLVGPSNTGVDCQPYNAPAIDNSGTSKFHIYFQQKYCANTGTSAPYGSASMAVDDTYEYGPEIINMYDGFVDGAYKVSVYNNDATAPDWTTSKARIYVYAGNFFTGGGGLIKTIDLQSSNTNRLWRPFKFSISGTTLTIDDNSGSTFGYTVATYAQMVGNSDGLGGITNLVISAGGAGYTLAPGVTISAPAGGGTTATATASLTGNIVTGLTITNAGAGYTSTEAITVAFTGGGGGAGAVAAGIVGITDPNTDPGLFSNGTTSAGGAGLADY